MAESKENIEAKLAEYLEGTLDPAGRAEIEQHLMRNPEHRQLMLDLGQTRQILQSLPRERAPGDMTEMLQGQLERTALLGEGPDESSAAALRINRWPQLFALAAIVLLAIGLGVVVYIVLPSSHPEGFTVIEKEVPADAGVAPPAVALAEPAVPATPDAPATPPDAPATPPAEGALADAGTGARQAPRDAMARAMPTDTAQAPADRVEDADLRVASVQADGREMVVVLGSSDLSRAEDRIIRLLSANDYRWERIDRTDVQAPLMAGPVQMAARQRAATEVPDEHGNADQPGEVADSAAAKRDGYVAADKDQLKVTQTEPQGGEAQAVESQAVGPQVTGPQAAVRPEAESQGAQAQQGVRESATTGRVVAEGAANVPAGQTPEAAQQGATAGERVGQFFGSQAAVQAPQVQAQQAGRIAQNQYVVRGLTRQQANELVASLQQSGAEGVGRTIVGVAQAGEATLADATTQVTQGDPADIAAGPQVTTQPAGEERSKPAAEPIRPGERLTIVVDELEAPGVEPVSRETVDAEGQIRLQMIGQPLAAAGLTEAELERAIAERYRDADLIPQATVRIFRGDAATQPARALRGEAERVDVVIMLEEPADQPETPQAPAGPRIAPTPPMPIMPMTTDPVPAEEPEQPAQEPAQPATQEPAPAEAPADAPAGE